MKLYELDGLMRNFELEIDEETGEIKNAEELDKLEMEIAKKQENVALYIKNLKAESDALSAELKKMRSRKDHTDREIEWLKDYLAKSLEGEKMKTARVSVSYRTSRTAKIDDLSLIPKEYLRIKDPEPQLIEIRKAIEDGKAIAGAHIEEKESMIVK